MSADDQWLPRVVPPRDELKERREQAERRSVSEWIAVAREHLKKAKDKR